ncbi:MAG: hypothetical protein ACREFR_17490, partial [Limisphaerales bacterium]
MGIAAWPVATSDKAAGQKGLSPKCFANNGPAISLTPQSQVHDGHAPSSRVVGGPFLAKQQYP